MGLNLMAASSPCSNVLQHAAYSSRAPGAAHVNVEDGPNRWFRTRETNDDARGENPT